MTVDLSSLTARLLASTTRTVLRPRYEGCNICTWIGFKHVNYLVEEAVLEHFRDAGLPARALFEEYGLGLDIVSLRTQIRDALHADDDVAAQVVPEAPDGRVLRFRVTLDISRGAAAIRAVTATAAVTLRRDSFLPAAATLPAELADFAVSSLADAQPQGGLAVIPAPEPVLSQLVAGKNAFAWKWRIGYPYCHFSERLQMSGYLRLMEEAVDLFLADRGISIRQLLTDRRWIPVVPNSQLAVLDEALMEEELYTVLTVTDLLKDLTYTARMDCYVRRAGGLARTATGTITHGYAVIDNRRDWHLVSFDPRVRAALTAAPAPEERR